MELQQLETQIPWKVAVGHRWIASTRREIENSSSDTDASRRKYYESNVLNISRGNLSYRARFSDLDADIGRTASQYHLRKSQTSQLETDDSCSHLMDDVCVAKKNKI